MICHDCDHRSVCYYLRAIEDILDKLKDEMLHVLHTGEEEPSRYHVGKGVLDGITNIDESLKRFEDEIPKLCGHYKEKTSE
jgi:hypothetical protein